MDILTMINSVTTITEARDVLNEVKTMLANNLAAKIAGGDELTMEDHTALTTLFFELLD